MKDLTKKNDNAFYYVLVEEWNYPTESGRDTLNETFDGDDLETALCTAKSKCTQEMDNFEKNINGDSLKPEMLADEEGYIITSKMGLDPYYYAVRIVTMKKIEFGG